MGVDIKVLSYRGLRNSCVNPFFLPECPSRGETSTVDGTYIKPQQKENPPGGNFFRGILLLSGTYSMTPAYSAKQGQQILSFEL